MAKAVLSDEASELSTYVITVTFTDEDNAALTPDTGTWTLTELDGTVVNSRTAVAISPLASESTIVLTGNDLAILDGDDVETRILTVEATYSSGRTIKDDVYFKVRNLTAVS